MSLSQSRALRKCDFGQFQLYGLMLTLTTPRQKRQVSSRSTAIKPRDGPWIHGSEPKGQPPNVKDGRDLLYVGKCFSSIGKVHISTLTTPRQKRQLLCRWMSLKSLDTWSNISLQSKDELIIPKDGREQFPTPNIVLVNFRFSNVDFEASVVEKTSVSKVNETQILRTNMY